MDYSGVNSVPLGEAGTGAAYILPQSQAIGQVGAFIDSQDQLAKRAELLKQKQAQQLAAAWKDNQLKIKGGTLFQPEINKRASDVMQMGLDLQKAGINPNTVSTDAKTQALVDQYHKQRTGLLSDVDTRDAIAKQAVINEKALAAQPDGYYDTQSVQDYHDFLSGKIPLSDITGKGLQMPELRKTFDIQPAIAKIPGVPIETTTVDTKTGQQQKLVLPNKEAHAQLANGLIKNSPEVQADIAKKAGMPFKDIGNTTDLETIKKNVDDFWRSQPNVPALANMGITTYNSPGYKDLVDSQAKKIARAAKVKQDYTTGIVDQLNAKVHQQNDKTLNFRYQEEMRARRRQGQADMKFDDWLENQQNEAGTFNLGNQDSNVPVLKTYNYKNGTQSKQPSFTESEKGASLYGVNLPSVHTIVRPSLVTDIKTGRTSKNSEPIDVKVSQMQMVPVWKDLPNNDPRNGSELSARQIKDAMEGKGGIGNHKNITFQPYVYGLQSIKTADANGNLTHAGTKPIKFSYDALKGSNVKKINTTQFDQAGAKLQELKDKMNARGIPQQEQIKILLQTYGTNLND